MTTIDTNKPALVLLQEIDVDILEINSNIELIKNQLDMHSASDHTNDAKINAMEVKLKKLHKVKSALNKRRKALTLHIEAEAKNKIHAVDREYQQKEKTAKQEAHKKLMEQLQAEAQKRREEKQARIQKNLEATKATHSRQRYVYTIALKTICDGAITGQLSLMEIAAIAVKAFADGDAIQEEEFTKVGLREAA